MLNKHKIIPIGIIVFMMLFQALALTTFSRADFSHQEKFLPDLDKVEIVFDEPGFDNTHKVPIPQGVSLKNYKMRVVGSAFSKQWTNDSSQAAFLKNIVDENLTINDNLGNGEVSLALQDISYEKTEFSQGTALNISKGDDLLLEPPDNMFVENIRVDDGAINHSSGWPAIAIAPDDTVHVVYHDARDDPHNVRFKVFYTHSLNTETPFIASKRVENTALDVYAQFPDIAIGPDYKIHIVWYDNRTGNNTVYYAQSDDNGTTFDEVRVWDNHSLGAIGNPSIALAPNGSIHVSWSAKIGNDQVFHTMSLDGGQSFLPAKRIDPDNNNNQYWLNIAVDSNNKVYAAFSAFSGSNWNIYLARADNGMDFTVPTRVNDVVVNQCYRPDIEVDTQDRVHVAWMDPRGMDFYRIYYARSDNNGANFGASRNVADGGANNQQAPNIMTDQKNKVHIAFHDFRNGDPDVFYSNSSDGIAFTPNKRIDDDPQNRWSGELDMAVDSNNNMHFVWMDGREPVFKIFYSGTLRYKGEGEYTSLTLDLGSNLAIGHDAYLNSSLSTPASTSVNVTWSLSPDAIQWTDYFDVGENFQFTPTVDTPGNVKYLKLKLRMEGNGYISPVFSSFRLEGKTYATEGWIDFTEMDMAPFSCDNGTFSGDLIVGDLQDFQVYVQDGQFLEPVPINTHYDYLRNTQILKWRVKIMSDGSATPKLGGFGWDLNGSSFPSDIELDLYNDGTMDWEHSGALDGQSNMDIELNNRIVEDEVYLNLNISSSTPGHITLDLLDLSYNSPPEIVYYLPGDLNTTMLENSTLTFNLTAFDPENDDLNISWYVDKKRKGYGEKYDFSADFEDAGMYDIEVTVTDGEFDVSLAWELEVVDVNRPPEIIRTVPETEAVVKVDLDPTKTHTEFFLVEAQDPDGDVLSFSWYLNGTDLELNDAEHSILITEDLNGSHIMKYIVTDGEYEVPVFWYLNYSFVLEEDGEDGDGSGGDGDGGSDGDGDGGDGTGNTTKPKDDPDKEDSTFSNLLSNNCGWLILALLLLIGIIVTISLIIVKNRKGKDLENIQEGRIDGFQPEGEPEEIGGPEGIVTVDPLSSEGESKAKLEPETDEPEKETSPSCPTCNQPSEFYEEYDCFWCDNCQNYVYPDTEASPEDIAEDLFDVSEDIDLDEIGSIEESDIDTGNEDRLFSMEDDGFSDLESEPMGESLFDDADPTAPDEIEVDDGFDDLFSDGEQDLESSIEVEDGPASDDFDDLFDL